MNKFITTDNGGLPIQLDDFRFIDDSVRNAFKGLISAFGINPDESFILSGAGSTLNGPNYDIAAGYICLNGEVLEVEAHSIPTTLGPGEAHVWRLKTTFDPAGLKTFESTLSFDTYEIRQAEVVVEVPVGGFMPMLAPTIHQRMAANGFGTILQTKVLDIGNWDMDADITLPTPVAHGLTDITKIRSVSVMILNDAGNGMTPLDSYTNAIPGMNGGITSIGTSAVAMSRRNGGLFDHIDYNNASINRGYLTIKYEL